MITRLKQLWDVSWQPLEPGRMSAVVGARIAVMALLVLSLLVIALVVVALI